MLSIDTSFHKSFCVLTIPRSNPCQYLIALEDFPPSFHLWVVVSSDVTRLSIRSWKMQVKLSVYTATHGFSLRDSRETFPFSNFPLALFSILAHRIPSSRHLCYSSRWKQASFLRSTIFSSSEFCKAEKCLIRKKCFDSKSKKSLRSLSYFSVAKRVV